MSTHFPHGNRRMGEENNGAFQSVKEQITTRNIAKRSAMDAFVNKREDKLLLRGLTMLHLDAAKDPLTLL